MIASLARQSPALAWLLVSVLLAGLCWAAAAFEDWWHRHNRHRRPSWARWRRTRAAWRAARYRAAIARLYLDTTLGI